MSQRTQPRPSRGLEAARAQAAKDGERQHRLDVIELLGSPAFRRYMAFVIYGHLGLKAPNAWRRDAEIHKVAARKDVAAELLADLQTVDPAGFLQLELEHVNRMAQELELAPSTSQGDDDVPQDS